MFVVSYERSAIITYGASSVSIEVQQILMINLMLLFIVSQ